MKRLREFLAQAVTRMKPSADNQGAPGRLPEVLDVTLYQIMELGLATLLVTILSATLPPPHPLRTSDSWKPFTHCFSLGWWQDS